MASSGERDARSSLYPGHRPFLGKVAVVTGASAGIGQAIAREVAKGGASLVLAARDPARLRAAVDELAAAGTKVIGVPCDVRRRNDVEQLRDVAYQTFGTVDFLVNTAGLYPRSAVLDLTEELWDTVIDTNVKGVLLCCQAFVKQMIAQGVAGRIVNMSSVVCEFAGPGLAAYGASKAALNQLTRVMAVEWAPHGILVNAVCPGRVATERFLEVIQRTDAVVGQPIKDAQTPLGRFATPEEVAAVAVFLLGPGATYFTGSALFVDGGFTLGATVPAPVRVSE